MVERSRNNRIQPAIRRVSVDEEEDEVDAFGEGVCNNVRMDVSDG